jgi:asparagine synthase (glutamine-hydrolysing)
LQSFVGELIGEGFPPLDVPDAFYTFERVRRWAGSNARKSRAVSDRFSPFCTKTFVEAAFRLPALYRCSEPLHYEVIRLLLPELHRLPFGNDPWPFQQPFVNLVRMAAERQTHRARSGLRQRIFRQRLRRLKRAVDFDHTAWLEAKCAWLRELCLDQPDSLLWEFVDRAKFERLTAKTADAAARRGSIDGLYAVATLFHDALT